MENKSLVPIEVGDIYETKDCGFVEVVEYNNSENVLVRFLDTSGLRTTSARYVRQGIIKDYLCKTVFGRGCYGYGEFVCKVDRVQTREYTVWRGMLERCYCEKLHKKRPTYKDCVLCDGWHNYQVFAKWYTTHPFLTGGSDLDKDLLFKGNKLYSPETCILIPHSINEALTLTNATRGDMPVGVFLRKGKRGNKYTAGIVKTIDSVKKRHTIGTFNTPEEAFLAYKKEKEAYIKSLADKHKHELDPRAYKALYEYTIDIGD